MMLQAGSIVISQSPIFISHFPKFITLGCRPFPNYQNMSLPGPFLGPFPIATEPNSHQKYGSSFPFFAYFACEYACPAARCPLSLPFALAAACAASHGGAQAEHDADQREAGGQQLVLMVSMASITGAQEFPGPSPGPSPSPSPSATVRVPAAPALSALQLVSAHRFCCSKAH